ncbi:MAG: hypothetical protein F4Y67_01085 [Chloroflexi bacterium]|nr:hypothetical protein [Chloroflexota bacterium]
MPDRFGTGPGNRPPTIDEGSTICETHRSHKQGARDPINTGQKGYNPLIASISGSAGFLHVRMREGTANTSRGAAEFVAESIFRGRGAWARFSLTALWPARRPLRHVRWLYHRRQVYLNARMWGRIGIGMSLPHQAELDHRERIRRGET